MVLVAADFFYIHRFKITTNLYFTCNFSIDQLDLLSVVKSDGNVKPLA